MSDRILRLDSIDQRDFRRVGGKAANLARLTQAGFPVPRGFCVPSSAYQQQLNITIPARDDVASASTNSDRSGENAQLVLLQAPILPEIEAAIRAAYHAMGDDIPVAVRSSATAEDMLQASFAGQMDTFLCVRGDWQLLEATRRCWASLWNDRAINYRNQQKINPSSVAMAVVVQEMVPAEIAGVTFTASPVTGVTTEMTVEAVYGLGEGLVAGLVTGDTYTIAKDGLAITRREVARKERKIVPQEDRWGIAPVPEPEQNKPCLTDSQLREIARIGLQIERQYGIPQDIEWAFAGERLYILQSRPITALPDAQPPMAELPGLAEGVYGWIYIGRLPRFLRGRFIRFVRDHFPHPLRPFDIYNNLVPALSGLRRLAAEIGIQMPTDVALPHKSGLVLFSLPVPPFWQLLWRAPRLLRMLKVWVRYDPLREWEQVDEPQLRALIQDVRTPGNSPQEAIEAISNLNAIIAELMYRRFRKYMAPGVAAHRRLSAVLQKLFGKKADEFKRILTLHTGHKTALINQALNELSRAAAHNPSVRRILAKHENGKMLAAIKADPSCAEFARRLSEFLAQFGYRTAMTMEPQPSYPAWRDEPDQLLGLVSSMLQQDDTGSGNASAEKKQYCRARADVARRLHHRRKLASAFEWSVDTARGFTVAREASLYLLEEIVGKTREIADGLASHLVSIGRLRSPDHIYYLSTEEIRALTDDEHATEIAEIARHRQTVWQQMRQVWDHPPTPSSTHLPVLRGSPVSRGIATGPAKVLRGAADFHKLEPGDILVCMSTSPAWTPLFAVAAAVVADTGNVLSHAAIVAREYGIPAVMGCGNATSTFSDGEPIEVNGSAGTVRRLKPLQQ